MNWVKIIQMSIYFGFGLFTILSVLFGFIKDESFSKLNQKTVPISFLLIKWAGVIFILIALISIYYNIGNAKFRLVGDYYFTILLPFLIFGFLPQLLWIKYVRKSKLILIVLSVIFIVFANFDRFIIYITSLHQDYLATSWSSSIFFKPFLMDGFISLSLFSFYIFVIYVVKSFFIKTNN